MGRLPRKSDCADFENSIRDRNAICSANLLKALLVHHGAGIPESVIEEPEAVVVLSTPLPPIPNKVIAAAAEIAFPKSISMVKAIQRATLHEFHGVSLADLTSRRRSARVVLPRQIAVYLAKTLTNQSLPEIGRRFGGRDHSTILFAVRKIENLVARDQVVAAQVERIKERIPEFVL